MLGLCLFSAACQNKTYGENCAMKCGHCKGGKACDPINGHCMDGCQAGYIQNQSSTLHLCQTGKIAGRGTAQIEFAAKGKSLTFLEF